MAGFKLFILGTHNILRWIIVFLAIYALTAAYAPPDGASSKDRLGGLRALESKRLRSC